MQAAEGLGAIAAIVEEVALGLDQNAAAVAGQQADGEMVGQRAGGQPDGRFLAEQRGHAGFQLLYHAAARVVVGRQVAGFVRVASNCAYSAGVCGMPSPKA